MARKVADGLTWRIVRLYQESRLSCLSVQTLRYYLHWTLEEIASYFGHVTVKGTPAIQTTVRSPSVSWTQVQETLKLLKGEEGWACACVSARTVRMCFSSHTLPSVCAFATQEVYFLQGTFWVAHRPPG
jgi:hypothetical protein